MNLDSNSQVNTSVADPDPVLLKNIIPDKNLNPGFKLDVMGTDCSIIWKLPLFGYDLPTA